MLRIWQWFFTLVGAAYVVQIGFAVFRCSVPIERLTRNGMTYEVFAGPPLGTSAIPAVGAALMLSGSVDVWVYDASGRFLERQRHHDSVEVFKAREFGELPVYRWVR